ncbi:hypothetical protein [Legionella steigerwaltii]|nr:hypothetical protein [Legionella steigerwaltii]
MPGFNLLSDQEQEFALKETTRIMQEKYGDKQEVGSTLTSLVAWKDPKTNKLHGVTSNVGDSLTFFVIIGADGKVRFEKQLNTLHENKDRSKIKIGVSRSIGDKEQEINGLKHDPDITREAIPLQEGDRVFAIAASDGISTENKFFNTPELTSTDIAQTLSEFVAKNPSCGPDDIAEALISKAYAGGKGSVDNIGLVVAEVGEEPISLVAADGHGGETELGEKGEDVSKAIAENFHSQLKTQMKLVKPQAYVDALREGNYQVAANLGRLLFDRYVPLNDGNTLEADDVTPLMASLLAETDITIDDMVRIQHGASFFSSDAEAEARYYMTQMGAGAITLFSNELKVQKENKDKSPQAIRQMIRDEINKATAGPYKEKNAAQEVKVMITNVEKSQEIEDWAQERMTPQRVFAYAVGHLIKDNVKQIRAAGNLLNSYLNNIIDNINRAEPELNKDAERLQTEMDEIKEKLQMLGKKRGELPQEDFLAQKGKLDEAFKLKRDSRLVILSSISEANSRKRMIEDELLLLCTKPEKFKDKRVLEEHIRGFLEEMMKGTSTNELLTSLPVEAPLQNVYQQIESYLDILNNNPVAEPDKNPKLLIAYNARKEAAENIRLIIKTSGSRSPQETLERLEKNVKVIENNRPGIVELGPVDWLKAKVKEFRAWINQTIDPLKSAKTEVKELRKNSGFFETAKKEFEEIRKEHEAKPEEGRKSTLS